MQKIKKYFNLAFVSLFLFSLPYCTCSESQTLKNDEMKNLKKYEILAKEKFKKNYLVDLNSSQSFAICSNNTKSNSFSSFFIYDILADKMLFEDSNNFSSVKWINEHQIKVSVIPGIVKGKENEEENNIGYMYDVKKKQKISKINEFDVSK